MSSPRCRQDGYTLLVTLATCGLQVVSLYLVKFCLCLASLTVRRHSALLFLVPVDKANIHSWICCVPDEQWVEKITGLFVILKQCWSQLDQQKVQLVIKLNSFCVCLGLELWYLFWFPVSLLPPLCVSSLTLTFICLIPFHFLPLEV